MGRPKWGWGGVDGGGTSPRLGFDPSSCDFDHKLLGADSAEVEAALTTSGPSLAKLGHRGANIMSSKWRRPHLSYMATTGHSFSEQTADPCGHTIEGRNRAAQTHASDPRPPNDAHNLYTHTHTHTFNHAYAQTSECMHVHKSEVGGSEPLVDPSREVVLRIRAMSDMRAKLRAFSAGASLLLRPPVAVTMVSGGCPSWILPWRIRCHCQVAIKARKQKELSASSQGKGSPRHRRARRQPRCGGVVPQVARKIPTAAWSVEKRSAPEGTAHDSRPLGRPGGLSASASSHSCGRALLHSHGRCGRSGGSHRSTTASACGCSPALEAIGDRSLESRRAALVDGGLRSDLEPAALRVAGAFAHSRLVMRPT